MEKKTRFVVVFNKVKKEYVVSVVTNTKKYKNNQVFHSMAEAEKIQKVRTYCYPNG